MGGRRRRQPPGPEPRHAPAGDVAGRGGLAAGRGSVATALGWGGSGVVGWGFASGHGGWIAAAVAGVLAVAHLVERGYRARLTHEENLEALRGEHQRELRRLDLEHQEQEYRYLLREALLGKVTRSTAGVPDLPDVLRALTPVEPPGATTHGVPGPGPSRRRSAPEASRGGRTAR